MDTLKKCLEGRNKEVKALSYRNQVLLTLPYLPYHPTFQPDVCTQQRGLEHKEHIQEPGRQEA